MTDRAVSIVTEHAEDPEQSPDQPPKVDPRSAVADSDTTVELERSTMDVLLCLADVASRKTLSFRERKMFDHARQLLVFEVAEVLDRTVERVDRDVEKVLAVHMEPPDED